MSSNLVQENIDFSSGDEPYNYDLGGGIDVVRTRRDALDSTLNDFFARPIKIYETDWTLGSSLNETFDPWTLFFGNKRIINRINNYQNLRANIHLRFMVNGNQFYYGKILASYLPYAVYDEVTAQPPGLIDMVQRSQMQKIFIDPTTSTGGDMVLPFFHAGDYLDIVGAEWRWMGYVNMFALNLLKHANGGTAPVTISVFAWATNVHVAKPTCNNSAVMVPQAGEIDHANKTGVVSKPASVIASISAMLTKAPYIGNFALATHIAATAVGNVAALFGYGRPIVTKSPDPVVPRLAGNLALTNVPDTCHRLTVDDEQELTIDPKVASLDSEDPLTILSIAKRESYFATFNWATSASPETLLFSCKVDPVVFQQSLAEYYLLTATAVAALPFAAWTGTLRYRFQIVCSAVHKGRLKIVYEPNSINGLAVNEYNTNYLKIVDLADTNDFTIEISPSQVDTFMYHAKPGVDTMNDQFNDSGVTVSGGYANGVFGVYVVSQLTSPNTTVNNDITVNVFISAGDDFQVAQPDNFINYCIWPDVNGPSALLAKKPDFEPQMGRIYTPPEKHISEPGADVANNASAIIDTGMDVVQGNAPVQSADTLVNGKVRYTGETYKVYYGERITSFRQLLKRYNLWRAHITHNFGSLDPYTINMRAGSFPYYRGSVPAAVDTTTLGTKYNYCNTVLIHWVTINFSGWRGSIRYKILPLAADSESADSFAASVQISPQQYPAIGGYRYAVASTPPHTTPNEANSQVIPLYTFKQYPPTSVGVPDTGITGTAVSGPVNPVLEFEVPYYQARRFVPIRRFHEHTEEIRHTMYDLMIRGDPGRGTSHSRGRTLQYVATGEDFQCYMWTGMPPMTFEASPPS